MIAAAVLAVTACAEPTDVVVPEPEIRPLGAVSLDGFSFFFPVGLTSKAQPKPAPTAPANARWAMTAPMQSGVRANCASIMCSIPMAGCRWAMLGRADHDQRQARLPQASERWQHALPDHQLLWGTTARQSRSGRRKSRCVLGHLPQPGRLGHGFADARQLSVRSAGQECQLMFPRPREERLPPPGYTAGPAPFPTPKAPRQDPQDIRPPAPPPLAPLPPGAEEICQEYLDAD